MNVHQPNIEKTVVLTADLSIARHETDALLNNRHPFLEFNPAGFSSMLERDMPDITSDEGGFCGVCSEQNLAKKCDECDMQFCLDCDERWHCHKLRRNHIRTSLFANKNKDQTQRLKKCFYFYFLTSFFYNSVSIKILSKERRLLNTENDGMSIPKSICIIT